MDIRVGHLPDPYRLDVASVGEQPIWAVEKIVMNAPDPDPLGPYIRRALREELSAKLRVADSGGPRGAEC